MKHLSCFSRPRFVYKDIEGLGAPNLRPQSSLRNFLSANLDTSDKQENFDLAELVDDVSFSTNLHIRNIALTLVLAAIQKKSMLPSEFLAPFEKPYLTPSEADHNGSLVDDPDEDAAEIPIAPRTAIQRLVENFLRPLKKRYQTIETSFVPFFLNQISSDFLRSLGQTPETTEELFIEEDFLHARAEIRSFLQQYPLLDFETLATLLKNISVEYSYRINIYKLFDEDLLRLLEIKLLEGVKSISLETYRQFFQRNEKEFIFYFLFSRIIQIDQNGVPRVDQAPLRELLAFICDQQKLSENDLYLLIYDTLRSWFCILRENSRFRARLRIALPGFLSGDLDALGSSSAFHHEFDFDRFFHTHFSPVIRNIRDLQLPDSSNPVEIVDIMSLDPQNMARSLYPKRALEPVVRHADLPEGEFMAFVRSFLNYESIPAADPQDMDDTNGSCDETPKMDYLRLSDEEVKELIALQLERVEAQIRYTTDLAFTLRDKNDPIRHRCQFLEEIIKCRNFRKLVTWLAHPAKFRKEFSHHANTPLQRIQHEAHKMLEMLLFYRKNRFRHAFKKRKHWQHLLEQHFMGRLQVKLGASIIVPVRIKMELDPETDEPKLYPQSDGSLAPRYSYVNFYACIQNPDLSYLFENPDENVVIQEGEKKFLLYKKEDWSFAAATVHVPLPDGKEPHKINIWIYNPDGRFMHAKNEDSFVSAWLRGKVPSDILRNTIVVNRPEDADILRRFHYSAYSSGSGPETKISDRAAGRERGHARKRRKGSKQFAQRRNFSFASYATLLYATQDEVDAAFSEPDPVRRREKLEALLNRHTHIEYETQIMDFETIFLAFSDYTKMSHNRAYKPKLEWDILFQQYFPPTVYGQEFADDYLSGFEGNGFEEEDSSVAA